MSQFEIRATIISGLPDGSGATPDTWLAISGGDIFFTVVTPDTPEGATADCVLLIEIRDAVTHEIYDGANFTFSVITDAV